MTSEEKQNWIAENEARGMVGLGMYGHLYGLGLQDIDKAVHLYDSVLVFKGLLSETVALMCEVPHCRFFAVEIAVVTPLLKKETIHEVPSKCFPSMYKVAKLHSGGFFRILGQDTASKDDVRQLLVRTPRGDIWYPIEQASPTL